MATHSPGQRPLPRLTGWLLGAALVLHAGVLAERLRSLVGQWRDVVTEGGEGVHVHALWRAVHGVPLYGEPLSAPYAWTPGNVVYYRLHGLLLRLFGVTGEGVLALGRVLTFAWALAGAVAWAGLALELAGARGRRPRRVALGLGLLVFLGSHFVSWWSVSIRPDVPAMACVAAALWALLRGVRGGGSRWLLLASAAFSLAWSLHPLSGAAWAGCVLGLALQRRWREVLLLAVPAALFASATWLVGSPGYRLSVLGWTALAGRSSERGLAVLGRAWPQLLLAWLAASAYFVRAARGEDRAVAGVLGVAAVVTATTGAWAAGLLGANRNALFEHFVVVSALAALPLLDGRGAGARWLASLSLAAVAGYAAVQLAWPDRFGTTHLEGQWRAGVRAWLVEQAAARGEGTAWVLDDVLAQPWNAGGGKGPAYVLDLDFMAAVLGPGAFESVVRETAAAPGVRLLVGDADTLEFIRGDMDGCAPLPASAQVVGWSSCAVR